MTSLIGSFGQSLAKQLTGSQQQEQQQGQAPTPQAGPPGGAASASVAGSSQLPQSGVMQQWMQQIQALEERQKQVTGQGFRQVPPSATAQLPGVPPLQQAAMQGASGVQGLGDRLSQQYGIGGRGSIVDPAGNFTRLPNSAEEAIKFQFIAQALTNFRTEQAQKASQASIETGIGMVKNRARGSLAAMQSGMYQSLAEVQQRDIQRLQNAQPNFGTFIELEMQQRQEKLQRDIMRQQKKQARWGMVASIVGGVAGFALGGGFGAAGAAAGLQGAGIGAQIGQGAGSGAGLY